MGTLTLYKLDLVKQTRIKNTLSVCFTGFFVVLLFYIVKRE